ncbi:hypothetical protein D3C87_1890180 [compost metagenome]
MNGQRARRTHEHRVPVGGRFDGRIRSDVARGARPVLDHDGLLQHRFQLGSQQPRDDVVRSARGKTHDQTYGLVRIIRGVRERCARHQDGRDGLGDA